MSRFLLAIRVQLDFSEIVRFPLVNRLSFEMKSDVLKSLISDS